MIHLHTVIPDCLTTLSKLIRVEVVHIIVAREVQAATSTSNTSNNTIEEDQSQMLLLNFNSCLVMEATEHPAVT